MNPLTIVTSCWRYSRYMNDWVRSIARQSVRPGAVCIFTHGSADDRVAGIRSTNALRGIGINVRHEHHAVSVDFGIARNKAVSMASSEWIMHLDADDMLLPGAVEEILRCTSNADVVMGGYVRGGHVGVRPRLYQDVMGEAILVRPSLCSGNSPFRRSLWERSPYRTDMLGAWDTALWIGFARLGARFRGTKTPIFLYRQHADSISGRRRRIMGWDRMHTLAKLKELRRQYTGVAVVVPREYVPTPEREQAWQIVRDHYALNHPKISIIEERCATATWSKRDTVARALTRTKAYTVVVADADCLVSQEALQAAICAVSSGGTWATPHARSIGSQIVVMRHTDYDATGGIPVGVHGAVAEEHALSLIADTLVGHCIRGSEPLRQLAPLIPVTRTQQAASHDTLRKLERAAKVGKDALVSTLFTPAMVRSAQPSRRGFR